jgi:CheY-like chemotaxis protein
MQNAEPVLVGHVPERVHPLRLNSFGGDPRHRIEFLTNAPASRRVDMSFQPEKEMLRFTTAVSALVVCPDPETRNSLFTLITKCGIPCVCCCDLAIARTLLTSRPFGVVFCSDPVPDGNFRDLITELKRASSTIPVIVLSRSTEWSDWLSALDSGAFDYIACPPDPVETRRILHAAISLSSNFDRSGARAATAA